MENQPLFDPSEFPPPSPAQPGVKALPYPLWTEHKATLIFRYLRYFVYITKHGTYIDGFAGQQNEQHEGMWAAKLVIESEPRRLRHFHLVEIEKKKIPELEALKSASDAAPNRPKRTVDVYHGDFNVQIDLILSANTIKPKEATFCLLDQRTFECHWTSLEKIARYKPVGEHKIELFYFLSIGWLDRSFAGTTKNHHVIERWWGRDDWRVLVDMSNQQRAEIFVKRIREELGYASVFPWPIYESRDSRRLMYFMIHATDHPEAPKLMRRAYLRAVDPLEPAAQLQLEWESGTLLASDDVQL